MGLFTGLCTGYAQAKRLRSEANDLRKLVAEQLAEYVGLVNRLNDRVEQLESEHRKLRGRFYAARGELAPAEAAPRSREESKAEAFRRIGYVPGKPAPHGN